MNQIPQNDIAHLDKVVRFLGLMDAILFDLNRNQKVAVVALMMDVCEGINDGSDMPFEESNFMVSLKNGQFQLVAAEFLKWSFRNGKIDALEWYKRSLESALFQNEAVL